MTVKGQRYRATHRSTKCQITNSAVATEKGMEWRLRVNQSIHANKYIYPFDGFKKQMCTWLKKRASDLTKIPMGKTRRLCAQEIRLCKHGLAHI